MVLLHVCLALPLVSTVLMDSQLAAQLATLCTYANYLLFPQAVASARLGITTIVLFFVLLVI
jgi:preprotein translocase subunit SecG